MEVTVLTLSIIGIICAIYFGRKATIKFNQDCLESYHFEPIQLSRIAIASSPVFIIFAGFAFDERSSSYWNIAAAILLSSGIIGFLFTYIRSRTTQRVAIISTLVLVLYGLGFVVILLLLFALYAASNDDDNRNITEKMGF